MYEIPRCFKCGELGHLKAECPMRRTPPAKTPVAAPSGDGGEKKEPARVPPPRAPEEIADSREWANRIRAADPRLGIPHCGDDSDVVVTEFRRVSGLGPAHGCRLRRLAAQAASREDSSMTTPDRKPRCLRLTSPAGGGDDE